jgi:hypothetical protein
MEANNKEDKKEIKSERKILEEGRITISDNVSGYLTMLKTRRGPVDTIALLKDAQAAMNILEMDMTFGTIDDWMNFFDAYKTYPITTPKLLLELHNRNVTAGSGKGTKRSKEKLQAKYETMRVVCEIIMKDFKGDKRALESGIIIRTTAYQVQKQRYISDFVLAFPMTKYVMYTNLAFSLLPLAVMAINADTRWRFFLAIFKLLKDKDLLEDKRSGETFNKQLLFNFTYVIKESEVLNVRKILKMEGDIEETRKTMDTLSLEEVENKKYPPWARLLASGCADFRKLKQSSEVKQSTGAARTAHNIKIGSYMGSLCKVLGKGMPASVTVNLDTDSSFCKNYFSALSTLKSTHTFIIQQLFPRGNTRDEPILTTSIHTDIYDAYIPSIAKKEAKSKKETKTTDSSSTSDIIDEYDI